MSDSTRQRDIDTLNHLIELTLDSAHGYEDASKDAKNPQYRTLFGKRAIERKQLTSELQTEVRRLLGSHPAQSGTTLGKAERLFLAAKQTIMGSDDSLIAAVESGEDKIRDAYRDALGDDQLSAPVRDLIERSYVLIKAGHDQMSALKHQTEALS